MQLKQQMHQMGTKKKRKATHSLARSFSMASLLPICKKQRKIHFRTPSKEMGKTEIGRKGSQTPGKCRRNGGGAWKGKRERIGKGHDAERREVEGKGGETGGGG